MLVVLPLLGGFSLGLAVRRLFQAHFATAFRANTALGITVVAFLAPGRGSRCVRGRRSRSSPGRSPCISRSCPGSC